MGISFVYPARNHGSSWIPELGADQFCKNSCLYTYNIVSIILFIIYFWNSDELWSSLSHLATPLLAFSQCCLPAQRLLSSEPSFHFLVLSVAMFILLLTLTTKFLIIKLSLFGKSVWWLLTVTYSFPIFSSFSYTSLNIFNVIFHFMSNHSIFVAFVNPSLPSVSVVPLCGGFCSLILWDTPFTRDLTDGDLWGLDWCLQRLLSRGTAQPGAILIYSLCSF